MIELHWKDGILTVRNIPIGYRYFLADAHPPANLADHKIADDLQTSERYRQDISIPLNEGNFTFRARTANIDLPDYELVKDTGILPVRLIIRQRANVFQGNLYYYNVCDYIQIECVKGIDETPDPRVHVSIR